MSRKNVVFISLPMSGIPDKEVEEHILEAKAWYLERTAYDIQDVAFVHNLRCPAPDNVESVVHKPLWYLGLAISSMSSCDEVLFYPGWQDARGCLCEYIIAKTYGVPCLDMAEESKEAVTDEKRD